MEIILYAPEIPQNVGNIARTCAITGTKLTLVRPLGFSLLSPKFKRAGLDYWNEVEINVIDQLDDYLKSPFYFFSTKGTKKYTEVALGPDVQLIFGSETSGLPDSLHRGWSENFLTIPMKSGFRSLNLSNAVAIVLYEGLRQQNFSFLL